MSKGGFRAHFRRSILAGLAALMPLVLTVAVLAACWHFVDTRLARPINHRIQSYLSTERGKVLLQRWFGWTKAETQSEDFQKQLTKQFPTYVGLAIALLISIVFLYLFGWFMASYVGARLYARAERAISQLPLVKKIYSPAKRVSDFFLAQGEQRSGRFRRVVAVEYPRRGLYAMGYVTGQDIESFDPASGKRMASVFIPTSPVPATGFVLFVPEDEVIPLPWSVDESLAFLTTLGVGSPLSKGAQPELAAPPSPPSPPSRQAPDPTTRGNEPPDAAPCRPV